MLNGIERRRGSSYDCPVEFALDVLGGKWKPTLLAQLKKESLAYGELRRLVPRLSDKVLTERLHELEADGLVERTRGEDGRSRYALTSRAARLRPTLKALYDWGQLTADEMGVEIREDA
jgi:DNA-binding HxlR family transcriptional regulator